MKIARAEKTDMFKNKGIPAQKTKTQKQKRTIGSGRSKNLPLRRNLPATPEDLINLTPAMSAGNQRGLRPPFPPLHSFMALPVLPDVSEVVNRSLRSYTPGNRRLPKPISTGVTRGCVLHKTELLKGGAPTRFAGSNLLSPERSSNMFEGDMITNSSELVTPDKDNLSDHLQPGLYDEESKTEDGTETSQLPLETAALFCELDRELKSLMSTCIAIIDLPKQNGLKTQLNQSEHTPLSTPAVPKEKTLTQIETQLAGSEKTEIFRNEGIPSRKRKTQYLWKNKPEGIPSRKRKTQYLPKNKPDPGLSELSFEAPLPENAEKSAAIAASNATAGAVSSSSEASLIGMCNNNSHEDGDDTLAGHERRKRGAGSSAEGSGLKKAKVVEELLPMPVSLPTDQSERQGIGTGADLGVSLPTGLRIPGLVPKSAGAMRSGPATQRPIEVTQLQTPGETVMALEWPLQQQVSAQQLPQQQLPVASEEIASHLLLVAEGDKTLVENALATLESPAGHGGEELVIPPADQAKQMLAGQDRPTGLGGPSRTYQSSVGLNADIGSTLRDELVAAAERFSKATFEASVKASREEADQLRKERDDAQAAASKERQLKEVFMEVMHAKSEEARGLEQELQGMLEKHTQLRSELEALSAEHGRLKDAALSACDFILSGSSTRETSTSVIIEGLKNLPDRLATDIKDGSFNAVRDAFVVVRSRYDSTDLTKIGKGLAVAGDPHWPELEEIAKRRERGPAAANPLKASDASDLPT